MVSWTSEKDSTILKGIFAYYKIKINMGLLKYLADEIGEGCTPKAVSHRLGNLRKSGRPVSSVSQATSQPTSSCAAVSTPRTPVSSKKVYKYNTTNDDDDEDDDDDVVSPSVARKRGRVTERKSYAESEDTSDKESEEDFVPVMKKMKVNVKDETRAGGRCEEDDETDDFV